MTIFDTLPTVNKCCFCINLKLGCIFIAIYFMINSCASVVTAKLQPCLENANALQAGVQYTIYVVLIVQMVVLIISIAFIVGVAMDKPTIATWFMYSTSLLILFIMVFVLLSMIAAATNTECNFPYLELSFTLLLQVVVWIYFMVVVKSYQEKA